MNLSRFIGAVMGVWIVRAALNGLFYTQIVGQRYEQITSAHPDMFREVFAGYIVTDLIFAGAFAFLFVKVSPALGGGVMAGVKLWYRGSHTLSFCREPVPILQLYIFACKSGRHGHAFPGDCTRH